MSDKSMWAQLIADYRELLPCLFCAAFGSLVRLLVKGCGLTLREGIRDTLIGSFACMMTFFMLYEKVGQALLFFFSCASGFLSYEFLAFLPRFALEMVQRLGDKLKDRLLK